ncbi:SOS response-associated peptidase family protein [Nannocystis pusilla]
MRAESAATAPSSREVFARGRCGVLADGFYEWSGPKSTAGRTGSTRRTAA